MHFIFHTGHVGSTLVSRLLDETGVVLTLREPLPLRSLAEASDALGTAEAPLNGAEFDSLLELFMRLWGRGYESTLCTVVKATSSAGRAAGPILERHPAARAIYLNLRAEPYLATLLAGQNSPIDLKGHGAERMRRLQKRLGQPLAPLHSLSIGELAALGWLAESLSQADALERHGERVLSMDFEVFLAGAGAGMTRVAEHLGLPVDTGFASRMERSPVLTRYSKAPEHEYTPALRAEILADSRRRNQEEIRRGTAWLAGMGMAHPIAARVVNESGI